MLAHSDMLRHTPARRRPLYYFLYYVPRLPPDDILASCEQMKPFDCSEPYLRRVLRFIGITDIDAVRIEGVANRAIGPEKALVARPVHDPSKSWQSTRSSPNGCLRASTRTLSQFAK